MPHRLTIRIPDQAHRRWINLFKLLEDVLPLEFGASTRAPSEIAGEILVPTISGADWGRQEKLSSFCLPDVNTCSNSEGLTNLTVEFADDPAIPFPFRGRVLRSEVQAGSGALMLSAKEKVLATSPVGPVWALSEEAGVKHYRSAFSLPSLAPDGNLADVLNGGCFLEMLPLLHWLREISSSETFEGPSPRACFIFDDPNLHWPTYGFVDYHQLASHAQKENYHVSFATIPLDGWFAHRQTVEIFRENRRWLSLSVHGNNHTKGELGKPYSNAERSFLLQEAIQRIEGLERRTGLSISRVMIPPHGACSEQMLAALPVCGFEGACISHGSLRYHNKSSEWTNALGFRPSELFSGCPVLPRWGFSGTLQNTILLAAYLKQAIILRGHHQDLKDGPELLDESARFINGLGSVEWLNLTDMARSNYQWRIQGDHCRVRPLGRKIVCSVAAGVEKIEVDPSCRLSEGWQIVGSDGSVTKLASGELVDLESARSISLEVAAKQSAGVRSRATRGASLSFIRRLLTEGRDRLQSTWR